MPITITTQPASNSLNAAYRPIVVAGTGTGNPVVYCDIYFNSIYYKTISKTQAPYDFDIQNAAKEYLKKYLPPVAGTSNYNAYQVITDCFVKLRGSAITGGFLVPELPEPIQATGTTAATSGGGNQSNTFYIVNATLQHEDNQDLATHLSSFKTGSWDGSAYPLSHRVDGYKVAANTSDYFPIISNSSPGSITLHYRLKSTGQWLSTGGGGGSTCVPVSFSTSLPNGTANTAYLHTASIGGTAPATISNLVKPSWMGVEISGSGVVFSGTPTAATTGVPISFTLTNPCGAINFSDTIDIAAACVPVAISGTVNMPNGTINTAYNYSISLTGTPAFSLTNIIKPSWMNIEISPNGTSVILSGTPIAEGSNIAVSFNVNNDCGAVPVSDTIDVAKSTSFGETTFFGGDTLNNYEIANLVGVPNAAVTIEVTTYDNTNGGQLQANSSEVFLNSIVNVTLDSSGNGSFRCDILGFGGNQNPGTVIRGVFTITSVSIGSIGSRSTYQNSKAF